ncbi:MAG: NAD(P)/FAD-dependent oxidoreductase [Halarsenatibacteraceae bacterium]
MYDIAIIGGGVVGTAIARELSKYELKTVLLEKESDVSTGASKANSGIVHGGYVGKAGTLKGELCIKGNQAFKKLNEELNFGFRRPGALVIGFNQQDRKQLKKIYQNAVEVGHDRDDIEIIDYNKIKSLESNISEEVEMAFYCQSVGVASPYEMVVALAENAVKNGVELKLSAEVININKKDDHFEINTEKENYQSRYIINAAGTRSEKIASYLGADNFSITPRRGQYILFGKDQADLVEKVIFQTPTPETKGVLVTTTYHGNFMIGPNSEEIDKPENIDTTIAELENIIETARKSIPDFDLKRALTTFAGVRASSDRNDFIIEESQVSNFINVAGIDSPGLTASPAIAEKVIEILKDSGLDLKVNENFDPYRKPIIKVKDENFAGEIDADQPQKNIICRCERVTEAEILDALDRNIPIRTTDAIKRRTRAGMGNCQADFCRSRVKKLIADYYDEEPEEIEVRDESGKPQRVSIEKIREIKK